MPMLRANAGSVCTQYGEAESKNVEVVVINACVGSPTFMREMGVCVPSQS